MSIDSLRKRLKEQLKNGTLNEGYTAPELPMMNQNSADTYTPPEVVVPITQQRPTPISTNTQTPKTTPISTPTNNTAKNVSIPASAKNSSQAKADPKSGEAGSKALNDILKADTRFFKATLNERLAEAYNAGFYGMDITREARDNARAGNYMSQLEEMYKAGKADSKGSTTAKNPEKPDNGIGSEAARKEQIALNNSRSTTNSNNTSSNNVKSTGTTASTGTGKQDSDDGLGTQEAEHEKLMRALNIKQAQKLAHTSDDSDDFSTEDLSREALLKEKYLQKKIDNQGKSGYNSDGISRTAGSPLYDFGEVNDEGLKISHVNFSNGNKNVQCVIYANNRAREYWGIEGDFEIGSGVDVVRKGEAAPFLTIVPGKDMQTLLNMPSHSLAFFGPTYGAKPNPDGHEVFIEGKDDKYIYFSESNYGQAPTNGKVQKLTYDEFLKRGGKFIGYAAIDMEKYKELHGY